MTPIPCPCCSNLVAEPTFDIVVDHYGISDFEARILGALWKAKGRPVATERIFDSMYVDDRSGASTYAKMYEALKFGLLRLRGRLAGSGVRVENVGYRQGFRLAIIRVSSPVPSPPRRGDHRSISRGPTA